ncbi:Gfo/Idh/MocA family protein [Paractinoplanes lichenicola]|uniref:Gfo/Idh/MocA family oxidoreductase n=1 Tax=Paractinoplanes lichenicola TaxID=2802976 RepID=A0ABS1VKS6_9ACTN|nr:Gfo/Idh/MocA family oxidoreductase [Actinoplanes lichenicola]MBL7255324.1 Gfo/Idh/MocA family oxidoreductase [Actinoplanes lichenicola]
MTVRWGMLSTAGIGRVVAAALPGLFVAVAGRDAVRAAAYAAELGVPRSHGSYEELLADDEVDSVYVPLPVALHTEWTLRALRAGKHVLCEKPFAMTAADATACFDAAEQAGRLCIEGLMWRHHPQTLLAQRLVAEGAIGKLSFIRAALSVDVPPGDIRRTGKLGGGALLDLGCYCVSAIRMFGGEPVAMSAARVADPAEGADGSDLRLAATLTMPYDVLAQFDVALDFPRRDELELIGTAGKIVVPDPWICSLGYVQLERQGTVERLPVEAANPYAVEFVAASRAIEAGSAPLYGRADAVAQAAVLEALAKNQTTG